MSSLLGGLNLHGRLDRGFCFKPLTGEMELAIVDARRRSKSHGEFVNQVLVNSLEHLAGQTPDENLVDQLCLADRQYLIRHFAKLLDADEVWLTQTCEACGAKMDVSVTQSELPFKPAGKTYPFFTVRLQQKTVKFRVPNNADLVAIGSLEDEHEAVITLVESCCVSRDKSVLKFLDENALKKIEQKLEAVIPELSEQIQVECPDCQHNQLIHIDPYLSLDQIDDSILADVHTLAKTYHWSERDILNLPRERRKWYLEKIA
jgi:hypothetical protein